MKTVDEFKGMKPEDVVKYIEGEPSISVVPVEPGLANMEKTDATGQRIEVLIRKMLKLMKD